MKPKQTPAQRAAILAEAKRELDACLAELSRLPDEEVQHLAERAKVAAGILTGVANSILSQHPWR